MSMASEVREINEEVRKGGYRYVALVNGDRIRIIGARVRKGQFQVHCLGDGKWITVDHKQVHLA